MAKSKKTTPKTRGPMAPFAADRLAMIRAALQADGKLRDLALLETAVDSMLRSRDLLALTYADVTDNTGAVLERFTVMQGKTRRPVNVALTPRTRAALAAYIKAEGKSNGDALFTRSGNAHGAPLTPGMFRRLVKAWCGHARLDPRRHSGHSLRRTKAKHVYDRTRNVAAVSKMLGHANLANTLGYLGITDGEVADLALSFEV